MAETVVASVLRRNDDTSVASGLVAELDRGGSRAMLPTVSPMTASKKIPCPDQGQGKVLVTPPEAIAIAEDIRRRLSRRGAERVRDRSAKSAELIAEDGADPESLPCALQGDDGVCRSYEVRPIGCRALPAAVIASTVGLDGLATEDGAPTWEGHAEEVSRGLTEGLSRGLEGAGLDGDRYELNAALVAALDTPDAAARWARGEDIFADIERDACAEVGAPTL